MMLAGASRVGRKQRGFLEGGSPVWGVEEEDEEGVDAVLALLEPLTVPPALRRTGRCRR